MERIRRFFQEGARIIVALLRPAARSLRDNSGLAVLSVVLAFALWIFVTDAESPTRTRVLPVDLEVSPINVPRDKAVEGDLATVRVRIRVSDAVFDSLTAADFEATVDLEGLAVGKYERPVEVRPLPSRGLRIEEVLPPKIDVTLTLLVSKSVPLVVDVEGDPPSGFTVGAAVAEDATVTVAGPRDKVDLVQQVVASLDVTGRTESVDQAVRLEARDDRGNLVESVALTLTPAITNVSMEIRQVSFTRALAVIPDVVGTPASGYNVAGLSVDPATVTVSGPKSFIEGTEFIRTKPVSVDGKDKDVVKTVSLDLPAGVEVRVIGGSNVTVTVKITPAQSEATFGVPVRATNLGGGLSISGALTTVRVTVSGPLPTLLDLSPDDIVASVDLKDKKEGSHRLKVTVTVPSGLEMRAVSPQEIEVSLEKG